MSIRSHGILILLATLGTGAFAQKADVMFASPGVRYFNMETGPGEKAVKGAPYSADAVTETVQVLANGNRIVHKLTAQVARDSQGRTRREQNLDAVGPWATAGEPVKFVAITDPV